MSRFRISISRVAECLDYGDLDDNDRKTLCRGISFDPAAHNIYRFFIAPVFVIGKQGKKRLRRRKSYTRVDRVLVQAKVPSKAIRLLGIHPLSQFETGEDDPGPRIVIPILGNMKIGGRAKDAVKRGRHTVIAYRTDEIAQWVFLKTYITSEQDFRMKALCVVDKDLDPEKRFLRCNVSFQARGREIEGAYRRRVEFPRR